jgi:hypothetical protein
MRTLGLIEPQLLIVAAFSRHDAALAWARQRLEHQFGPVGVAGPTIDFDGTRYYEPSMGAGLRKRFLAFDRLQAPDQLAAVKRQTIDLEQELTASKQYPEERPLNLDPGFLGLGKFILATTKDQAHRIYLHGGVFAEVSLRYHDGHFLPQPWTYPDWQHPDVLAFLQQARTHFSQLRTPPASAELPPLLVPPPVGA